MSAAEPRSVESIDIDGVSKAYGGVHALNDVSFSIQSGRVHALIGENGAGKSTLIKILAGAVAPDQGQIRLGANPVVLRTPHDAAGLGFAFVHQDPGLIPGMSVAENMLLGTAHYARAGITGQRYLRRNYSGLAERVGLTVEPDTLVENLPVAQRTLAALGRALAAEPRLIVMDEPTATFSAAEADKLFEIIDALTARGTGVVYVSHRLNEVLQIADTVTVLKNGRHLQTMPISEVDGRDHLVRLIVGKELAPSHHRAHASAATAAEPPRTRNAPALRAQGIADGRVVHDASISVHSGEVVGLTGLVGSGRTELAKILFGARARTRGVIEVDGIATRLRSPFHAVRHGIALLPENRRDEGALLELSLRENTTLPILGQFRIAAVRMLNGRRERRFTDRTLKSMLVKFRDTEQPIRQLSGGNQQKAVLGRWFATDPKILIVDEPTQGVDIGAKLEIHRLIRARADAGAAVLLITSDIEEAIEHSDRVVVMREGRTVADLHGPTEHDILSHCYGTAV